MSEERRALPVPRPDPTASSGVGRLGPRSPSASDEHPTPPDTEPTPIDAIVDSTPSGGPSVAPVEEAGAGGRMAPSRDANAARRRARMLRIPDDEIARPTAGAPEPTPSPSNAGSRPTDSVASTAPVESSVVLMPMRIITIGPSEPAPAELRSDSADSSARSDEALPRGASAAAPQGDIEWSHAAPRPAARAPVPSEDLIPIDSEPSEPAPVSIEPTSVDAIDEEPTAPPPQVAAARAPQEPEGVDIPLDEDVPTPIAPAVAQLPGERTSDPGSELSPEDLVTVDATPAPPKAPAGLPPMRPRLPSQPPVSVAKPPTPPKPPLVIVPPHVGTMAPQPAEGLATRRKGRLWWEDLFNDDYLRTCERLTEPQISSEVDFIQDRLSVERGGAVLDLGCGTGHHAIELARRGYEVVGFDLSLPMLARAGEEAQDRDTKLNFVQGDMREMVFEEQFDGVYSWNTSFGYFDEDKNAQVIDRVHRALKAGGLLLLDVINRDFLIRQSPSLAWFEGDGCVCMDEMTVDFITSRMKVKRTIMLDDGRSREIEYSVRVYSLHELGRILHEHRFKVCEVSGRTATPGVFFGNESPRIVILAEKR
jgi:SAM-dependent methyltransferase